jgi:hypothetical protein
MKPILAYRLATIAVPVVSLVVAVCTVGIQARRLYKARADLVITRDRMAVTTRKISEINAQPPITKAPTAAATPLEQPEFLTAVRDMAAACRVQFSKWTNDAGIASASQEKGPAAPPGITAITSEIEVSGKYPDARRFVYAVTASHRLYTMNDMVWVRNDKWPQTFLTLKLTRYVGPPVPGLAQPAAPIPADLARPNTSGVSASADAAAKVLKVPPTQVFRPQGLPSSDIMKGSR